MTTIWQKTVFWRLSILRKVQVNLMNALKGTSSNFP